MVIAGDVVAESGAGSLVINIPVHPRPSKMVLNMDHLAFAAGNLIGLNFARLVTEKYKELHVPIEIIAVFHGAAGDFVLDDAAYVRQNPGTSGNPYKAAIDALMQEKVRFELCAYTATMNKWVNADLLPGVKVVTGAIIRIIQLVQDGWVQIQP